MADLEARAKRVLSPVLGHYTWLPVDPGRPFAAVGGLLGVAMFGRVEQPQQP